MKDKKYKVVKEIFFGIKDTLIEDNLTEKKADKLLEELKKDEDTYTWYKKIEQ